MKKPILYILTIFLLSCNTKQNNSKVLETLSLQSQEIKKEKKCNCPSPFETAETQIIIEYKNGNYLKLCSWDFSKDSTTGEFSIYDQNDSLVLEGNLPSVFKCISLKCPVKLIESTVLKTSENKEWEETPIFTYEIDLVKNKFIVKEEFILKPYQISNQKIISILNTYNNQKKHYNKYNKLNPPFTNEEYIMDLFLCAVNGNKECIQAYDSLQTRFVTDGAIGELYYELGGLLQQYK